MPNVSLIDGHIDEPKKTDRINQMEAMFEQGMTYAEIGRAVGVSRQRVYQLIGGNRKYYIKITKEGCVYDGIREWMNKNKVSRADLVRKVYGFYCPDRYAVISKALKGVDTHKHIIDGILRATGLTYEEAFKVESEVTE